MKKGFTIVELLVAMTIFVVVVTVVSDVFFSQISAKRKLLAEQAVFEQASFLSEYLSRSLRMARKDLTGSCIPAGTNYQLTRAGQGVKILNSQSVCQEFYLDAGRLKEDKGALSQYLTGEDILVSSFSLFLRGEGQLDSLQPRVTFFLRLNKIASRPDEQSVLEIQTTVSQRKLDVQM